MSGTPCITVMTLAEARVLHPSFDAVVTIEDLSEDRPLRVAVGGPEQVVLAFEDLDEDGPGAACAAQVEAAIEFARRHAGGTLLVHCVKGQARSPAVALAVLADRLGPGREAEAVEALLAVRPDLTESLLGPNLHVVALADGILGREGALKAAWDRWEAENSHEGRERYRFWRKAAPAMEPR